jgi:hypothetical protein
MSWVWAWANIVVRPVPFQPTADVAEFADIIIDSAVLMIDGVQLTISRGGWTFDPGEEWEDHSFPGKTMATVGARSLVRLKPVIKGTALLSGEDQITAFRPDGTWANHATIAGARTFTPNALRAYLTEYLENVICLWKRIRGDYIAVEFPFAVCGNWGINATDADEGLIQITIEAVQDNDGTGSTRTRIPYRVRTVPTTPTPEDPEEPESEFGIPIDDRNAFTLGLADGNPVTVWGDDSTRSNPNAAPSAGDGQGAPTYRATGFTGGTPAVEFDGVNDGLKIATQITNSSFSQYFYVDAMLSPGGSGVGVLWDTPGGGTNRGKGLTVLATSVVGAPGGMGGYVNTHPLFPTFENVVDTWGRGSPTVYCFQFDKDSGFWNLYAEDMASPVAGESCPPQFTETSVTWVGYEPGLAPVAFLLQREVTYEIVHDATQRAAVAAALIAGTLP